MLFRSVSQSRYHRSSTMVTYTGFHVLPGVYLGLDVVQGDGGMG